MISKILKLILVLIVMLTIFMFSSENDVKSSNRSDGLIIRTTEFVLNRKLTTFEKEIYVSRYVGIVRKSAHFTLYYILGLTFILFLSEYDLNNKKLLLFTILFVFIYACSDECHQLFVSGRSGEVLDVLIDTFGGTVSSILYLKFRVRRRLHE